MNKELQNRAWAALPEDFKKEVKHIYNSLDYQHKETPSNVKVYHKSSLLKNLFGLGNLTAEEKPNKVATDCDQLNLCALLRGCEGMELYSPICGVCTLVAIHPECVGTDHTTAIVVERYGNELGFRYDGKGFSFGELMLYPSKEVRTWEGWVKPVKRWKPKEGEQYWIVYDRDMTTTDYDWDDDSVDHGCFECGNMFRTKEQAEEAAKRIRKVLEDYHKEINE